MRPAEELKPCRFTLLAGKERRVVAIMMGLFSIVNCGNAFARDEPACALELLVVRAITDIPILSWTDGVKVSEGKSLRVRVAQGTYTSASVLVRKAGQRICDDVAINVTALRNSALRAKAIPGRNVQVNYVIKWYQGGSAWTGISPTGPRKLIPELLVNDPEIIRLDTSSRRNLLKLTRNGREQYIDISVPGSLRGGSLIPPNSEFYVRDADSLKNFSLGDGPQQIWFSINVPQDSMPGSYSGFAVFSSGKQPLARLPIEVTVLPFSLPDPSLEYSIFYRGQLLDGTGTVSSEYKTPQQYRAEMRDMKRHGIRNPTLYQEFGNRIRLANALKLRREAGFTDERIYYLGLSAASAVDRRSSVEMTRNIEQLKSMFRVVGYNDPYLFAIDEAVGVAQRAQLASWSIVHDAGARVFATGRAGTYASVGHALDALILAYEPDQREVKLFHAAGKRVLTYAYPQSGPESPELFRRNYGVRLWAAGVDGVMPYAYMHSFGSSWNDFDHAEYRDHHFVYPTVNGVIGTLAWEGFHEAVEDVRYLTALEGAVRNLSEGGSCLQAPCRRTVLAVESFLKALRHDKGRYDLYAMRAEVIDQILSLVPDPALPPVLGQNNPSRASVERDKK